ncbi:unknown [Eggerthella sp. CAG:298]|nr:unknown [Eggerthella sp. CAG:298]
MGQATALVGRYSLGGRQKNLQNQGLICSEKLILLLKKAATI